MSSAREILASLERQYAITLGHYEVAEHAVEPLVGLKAVIAEDDRIQARKRILREKMDRITYLLRVQVDPEWEPGHVRPIYQKRRLGGKSYIAKAAYRVLKAAEEPLRVREIAHLVAPMVGLDKPDNAAMARLHSAIDWTLNARLKDDMVFNDGGTPKRWSFKPPMARWRKVASASSQPISTSSS
jgi:hypothetical protein